MNCKNRGRRQNNKRRSVASRLALMIIACGFLAGDGCGGGPVVIPEVTGTVTINGRPYPNVYVTFTPQAADIEGGFMTSGITDADGNFKLVMLNSKTGCPAVDCKVTIGEPPLPDEIQAAMMGDQPDDSLYARYVRSLKLRPIPKKYSVLKTTPFLVNVSPSETNFLLELKR